jgi:hypothetical protein
VLYRSHFHRESQSRPASELAANACLRFPAPNRAADAFEITAQLEYVTRLDDPLEAAVVDPCEERELACRATLTFAVER